ncbi:hypothetical protein INT47_013231 [Mucor saturninus]|uniref:Uncharacterized protein n=1 Tax=Mucor saturninus TaxID=64648 RepID=A0A8H7V0V5_9FUNG|nr:hypothetical protein INT47_013231 [Mucor saturninus]
MSDSYSRDDTPPEPSRASSTFSVRSIQTKREPSPSESQRSRVSKREESPKRRPKEEVIDLQTQPSSQVPTTRRANYTHSAHAKFVQKQKWGPLSTETMLDVKNILADAYENTLSAIPGSSQDNLDRRHREHLILCARSINKAIKRLSVPGEVDPSLLDPTTHELKIQHRKEFKEKKLMMGKAILQQERYEQNLRQKMEQLELLREKVQQEKQESIVQLLTTDVNQDYFQSLLRNPNGSTNRNSFM